MASRGASFSIEELPTHLVLEVLTSGRLGAADLAALECSCRLFGGGGHCLYPDKFRSFAELAAFQLCRVHSVFAPLPAGAREELVERCDGNWKRVLRFLQSVEQSSGIVQTTAGNVRVLCSYFILYI